MTTWLPAPPHTVTYGGDKPYSIVTAFDPERNIAILHNGVSATYSSLFTYTLLPAPPDLWMWTGDEDNDWVRVVAWRVDSVTENDFAAWPVCLDDEADEPWLPRDILPEYQFSSTQPAPKYRKENPNP